MLFFGHLHPKYAIFAQNMSSSPKKGNLSKFEILQKLHFFGENDIFWVRITYFWQSWPTTSICANEIDCNLGNDYPFWGKIYQLCPKTVIMAQITVNFTGTCLFSHLWQNYVILTKICPFLAKYVILKLAKITFFGRRCHLWQKYVILTEICPFLA